MTDKFEVKINCERGIYYLATTRNGYQWTSVPMYTPKQMCLIAEALIDKANELVTTHCPVCGIQLDCDYERAADCEAEIDDLPPTFLKCWCENCELLFNGLGEEV